MSTELTTKKDNSPEKLFQRAITDRIRADIGNLMPDEMLRDLVVKAIQAELMRDVQSGTNYHRTEPKPWLRDHVQTVLGRRVHELIAETLTAKDAELREMIAAEVVKLTGQTMADLMLTMMKGNMSHVWSAVQQYLGQPRGY